MIWAFQTKTSLSFYFQTFLFRPATRTLKVFNSTERDRMFYKDLKNKYTWISSELPPETWAGSIGICVILQKLIQRWILIKRSPFLKQEVSCQEFCSGWQQEGKRHVRPFSPQWTPEELQFGRLSLPHFKPHHHVHLPFRPCFLLCIIINTQKILSNIFSSEMSFLLLSCVHVCFLWPCHPRVLFFHIPVISAWIPLFSSRSSSSLTFWFVSHTFVC